MFLNELFLDYLPFFVIFCLLLPPSNKLKNVFLSDRLIHILGMDPFLNVLSVALYSALAHSTVRNTDFDRELSLHHILSRCLVELVDSLLKLGLPLFVSTLG